MRLKLVFIVSIIATIAGAGASIAIVLAVFSSLESLNRPGLLVLATFLLPAAAIVWATIFVYRHTARRRRLQAVLTALLSLLLTIGAFTAAILSTAKSTRVLPEPVPTNRNSG